MSRVTGADAVRVRARVKWRNAWRNARNHDAVWLVVKVSAGQGEEWARGRVRSVRFVDGAPAGECEASRDRVGAFCRVAAAHRGDVSWLIEVEVDAEDAGDVREALVFGTEMVYVPAGPFTIGDPDPNSVERLSFYRSDAQGRYAGTFRITSEAALDVGPHEGAVHYGDSEYGGDRVGPVPAAFPKGRAPSTS